MYRYTTRTWYTLAQLLDTGHPLPTAGMVRMVSSPHWTAASHCSYPRAAVRMFDPTSLLDFGSLFSAYNGMLQDEPLLTKALTAGTLAATGDMVAQRLSASRSHILSYEDRQPLFEFEYDARRGATFALFGAAYTGSFQHFWFGWLNDHLMITIETAEMAIAPWAPGGLPAPSPEILAAAKVAVNQFVVIPLLYMPLYFALTGLLGGLDAEAALTRMKYLYVPLLRRNYVFWLPIQFVQFFALPPAWHVPFLSVASLVWTCVLSTLGSGKLATSNTESSLSLQQLEPMSNAEAAASVNELTDAVTIDDLAEIGRAHV